MTILSVFEILLVEVKSVLLPAQPGTASKKVKIKVKNQKAIRIFLKNYLKCDRLIFYLFIYLFILFNPFSNGKIENSILEIPIIQQTLKISYLKN